MIEVAFTSFCKGGEGYFEKYKPFPFLIAFALRVIGWVRGFVEELFMNDARVISEKELAAIGINVLVKKGPKLGLFARLDGVKRKCTVSFVQGGVTLYQIECPADVLMEIKIHQRKDPVFIEGKAVDQKFHRHITFNGMWVQRSLEDVVFKGLGMVKEEAAGKLPSPLYDHLPIPYWVGAQGDYPHSVTIPAGKALNEVEDFLLALPEELLPKWVKLPDQFGTHFQRWMGNTLWPDWAWLEEVVVNSSSSGKPSVNVRREADWVPLNLGPEMPKVARDGIRQLAEVGAAGGALPSWARGSQADWILLRDELLKK